MSMASCMRARTASSFSTSKTPQGLRLGNGIRPVHPDTLSPAIFPSLPRLHHTRDRSDRFESPPRLLLPNSPLDTPPSSLSPSLTAYPASRPHTQPHTKTFPQFRVPALTIPTSPDEPLGNVFPRSICFYDIRAPGRSGIPQSLNGLFSCSFPLLCWNFRSLRVFTLAFHTSRKLVLRFTLSWFRHSSFTHRRPVPSNPTQRKRP